MHYQNVLQNVNILVLNQYLLEIDNRINVLVSKNSLGSEWWLTVYVLPTISLNKDWLGSAYLLT